MQKNVSQKFPRKTIFITLFAALALIAVVVFFARPTTSEAAEVPALQTAKVRTGDLVVTASGAGTVVPAAQVDLAFRSSGVVAELNAAIGDSVQNQQVLARLEENIQAEADFQALFTAEGVAQAQLAPSDCSKRCNLFNRFRRLVLAGTTGKARSHASRQGVGSIQIELFHGIALHRRIRYCLGSRQS